MKQIEDLSGLDLDTRLPRSVTEENDGGRHHLVDGFVGESCQLSQKPSMIQKVVIYVCAIAGAVIGGGSVWLIAKTRPSLRPEGETALRYNQKRWREKVSEHPGWS